MNGLAIIFMVFNAAGVVMLPRRWAALPLLIGACYITAAQTIDVGPFHFTVLRILLLMGALRVIVRREYIQGGFNGLDCIMLMWGAWLIITSAWHNPFTDAVVFRLGAVYNTLGIYFLLRVFCQSKEDLVQLIKVTAILLVPVSIEMVMEKYTGRNAFAIFGGVPETVMVRDGKLRAQGPFGHPILAGTVGAVCIPLMIGIWRQHTSAAKIGLAACLGMILASKSSGPLMTMGVSVLALLLWRWRKFTREMRISAVAIYLLLEFCMKDPAYFMLSRIDLTGSSTGWHRAELIRSALEHLNEWGFAGTDYTRHWMPSGVSWSTEHTDITNHFLLYGVWAGIPLIVLFICALWMAFRYVGETLQLKKKFLVDELFFIWSLGCSLFSHVVTCVSVAYFDQSVIFLYLSLAVIASLRSNAYYEVQKFFIEQDNSSTTDNEIVLEKAAKQPL